MDLYLSPIPSYSPLNFCTLSVHIWLGPCFFLRLNPSFFQARNRAVRLTQFPVLSANN